MPDGPRRSQPKIIALTNESPDWAAEDVAWGDSMLSLLTDGLRAEGYTVQPLKFFDDLSALDQYDPREWLIFNWGEEMAGRPTRIRFINAKMLSEIPSFWYVTVAPRERDGSALSKVMFADKLKQAVDIMTVTKRPLNDDKVIDEYEFTWQIKDMFKKTAPANQAASPEAQEQGDNLMAQIDALDSQMQEGEMGGQMNKPSLNTMVGNAQ